MSTNLLHKGPSEKKMTLFFVAGSALTLLLCAAACWLLQYRVNKQTVSAHDAKGYLLIACIIVGFGVSAGCFAIGQQLGYQQQENTSEAMGLALLLDVMVALLALIVGLVVIKEPEQY
jgi:hypothetical protein